MMKTFAVSTPESPTRSMLIVNAVVARSGQTMFGSPVITTHPPGRDVHVCVRV